jgi:type VI secretion system (T6SS) effector TldE1-like protein
MYQFQQSTGDWSRNGVLLDVVYSGNGAAMNNPEMQNQKGHGPIPQGMYTIGKFFDDPGGKGPVVADLIPDPENEMYGRSGFMLHGDNPLMNHSASDGCIIACHNTRVEVSMSGDNRLQVIA